MEFFRLSIVFILGGFAGFLLEFFFRRFVSYGRWVKPGFLVGPLIPLYAFGLSILYILTVYSPFDLMGLPDIATNILQTILLGVCATILEFLTGLFFLKLFRLRLWDYTSRKGNIMGLICPLFSLAWTALAGIHVFLLLIPLCQLLDILLCFDANSNSYGDGIFAVLFILGILYGLLIVDVFYSFAIATKLRSLGEKAAFNLELVKAEMADAKKKAQESFPVLLPFLQRKEALDSALAKAKASVIEKGERVRLLAKSKKEERSQRKAMKEKEERK